MDLDQLLTLAGLLDTEARRVAGVSARQWRRYRSGDTPIPDALARLLLAAGGQLGAVAAPWSGWRLCGDVLTSPSGETYSRDWFAGPALAFPSPGGAARPAGTADR